ncbi:MAG: hypothetical protein EA365_16335 [Gloeocapsa sp. DLM2.Bin57]|nr:MAG: hypothetical protein EA365_16335 [Gloeocapsa sp. DLM2.Bin57]
MSKNELIERIEVEIREIKEIVSQTELFVRQKQITEAEIYQEALSSAISLNLHSFYTGVERILELIARKIDHWKPTGEQWHRQLLEQMSIDLLLIRPAIISESTRSRLDEFRRFRHVVRSIYAYRIEANRVVELANQLPDLLQEFEKEIRQFITFIQGKEL